MKNDSKSRRVQAQRKFAQGAYIPPILNNNVVASRTDLAVQAPAAKEEKPPIYSNSSAKCLLDVVSFQGLHSHLQPVVLLKRLENPKESQTETPNGHVEVEKRSPTKEPRPHVERPHVPAKKPRLAPRTSTMCLRSRALHSKPTKKLSKKKTKKTKLKKTTDKNGIAPNKRVLEYMSSTSEDERPLKFFKNETSKNVAGSSDGSEARKLPPKTPRRIKKRRETSAILAATIAEAWGSVPPKRSSVESVSPKKKYQTTRMEFAVNEGASTSKDIKTFKQPQIPPKSRRMREKMAEAWGSVPPKRSSVESVSPKKKYQTTRMEFAVNEGASTSKDIKKASTSQVCLPTPNIDASDDNQDDSGNSRSSSIAPLVYSDTDESDKPNDSTFGDYNRFKGLEYDRFSLTSDRSESDEVASETHCVSERMKTVSDVSKLSQEELNKRCKRCIYCRRVYKVLQLSDLILRPSQDVYEFEEEDSATARFPLSSLKLPERISGISLTRVSGKINIYLEVFTKDIDQLIAIVPTTVANMDRKIMRARLVNKSKAQPSRHLNLKAHEKLLDVMVEVLRCSEVMRSDVMKLLIKAARQLQTSRFSRRQKRTPLQATTKRPRRQATLKIKPHQPTKRPRARRTTRRRTVDNSTETVEELFSDDAIEDLPLDETTEAPISDEPMDELNLDNTTESAEDIMLDQSLQDLIPDPAIHELMTDNLIMPDLFDGELLSTQESINQETREIYDQANEQIPQQNQEPARQEELRSNLNDENQSHETTPGVSGTLNKVEDDGEIIFLNSPEDSTIELESDDEIEITEVSTVKIPDAITLNLNMELMSRSSAGAKLLEAPTYTPTPEEFTDPIAYFEKISATASKYGICRVVAPPGFNPKCVLTDDLKFNVANQYIARMYSRWGPAAREMSAIKACLASQQVRFIKAPLLEGMELNLPLLYLVVQRNGGLNQVNEKKRWARVADEMRFPKNQPDKKLDGVYLKYLVPYETLSNQERQHIMGAVEKGWIKKNRKLMDYAMNPLHRQKKLLGESDSSEDEAEDEPHVTDALTEAEDCVMKGRKMNLSAFRKVSATAQTTFFPSDTVTVEQVEKEYWKLVLLGTDHVCVNSASIDTGDGGYGFSRGKSDPISRHPWNLKLLSMNHGNVLRSLGPVVGVTVPTLHLGMVFSTSCWHRDPHGLPWIEYMHAGPGKVWYGIPDEQSANFRKAVETLCPTSCQNKSIWLPSDITMIPPNLLQEHNVSLSRVTQKPGEFIIVFPKCYSCSIATGYTVTESVYFATKSWLKTVHLVFQELRDSCEPTTLSLEHLLTSLAWDNRVSLTVLQQVHASLSTIVREEQHNRRVLRALNITVTGITGKQSSVCLQHAVRLIEQPKYASIDLSTLTVVEYFTEAELEEILSFVEERLAPTNEAE